MKNFNQTEEFIGKSFPALTFHHFDEVTSTNDVARALFLKSSNDVAVLANRQTSGRGQHGRNWVSSSDKNIYLSIALSAKVLSGSLQEKSVAMAQRIAEEFKKRFAVELSVKPPNDLLLDGKKTAGILIESMPVENLIIVGIGMNLVHDETLQSLCAQAVTSIDQVKMIHRMEAVVVLISVVLGLFQKSS